MKSATQRAARWRKWSGESPPQHTIPPFGQSPVHVTAVAAATTVSRTPKPFIAVKLAHVAVVGIIFAVLTPTRSYDGRYRDAVSFHFYYDSNVNRKTYTRRDQFERHTHTITPTDGKSVPGTALVLRRKSRQSTAQ